MSKKSTTPSGWTAAEQEKLESMGELLKDCERGLCEQFPGRGHDMFMTCVLVATACLFTEPPYETQQDHLAGLLNHLLGSHQAKFRLVAFS